MKERFYVWLNQKYGWEKTDYEEIEKGDPSFAEDLMLQYFGRHEVKAEYEKKRIYENKAVR